MQISFDVHNYMETLVGHVLADEEYTGKLDHEQIADLACLALSQLRPIYIRHDIDFLSALPEDRLVVLKVAANDAVEAALPMILDDRRQHRDDDIPIIFSHPRVDDDSELEWFEKPLLKPKNR
ncbi:late competence development ComFB family protein [Vibrio sp. S4M6]|uniref:late competence development ComFB family protein n=1 Tax=Vibrio sinus TaxID=2946865 RepID=UPI00202A31AB|nr:late competence development ComFB family protein [Vibrio sinus]MCL9779839.1 late competence development ComFB family protein [Vibrio sinus]